MWEVNYHVAKYPSIVKKRCCQSWEGSIKKNRKKRKKEKTRTKEKGKTKGKAIEKAKKKNLNLVKLNLIGEKIMLDMQRNNVVSKLTLYISFQNNQTLLTFFFAVTSLDGFVKLLVDESNLYDQRNCREFHTNKQEIMAFLGINYVRSINKLPAISGYWVCKQLIGIEDIKNVMARTRFEDIFTKCPFSGQRKRWRKWHRQILYQAF